MAACISRDLGAGRDLAGADRPDRLIGDGQAGRAARAEPEAKHRAAPARPRRHVPASRTARLSPTHRMTRGRAAKRGFGLGFDFRIAFALGVARSLNGRRWSGRRPHRRSICAETQPVCAPFSAKWTSWPPIAKAGNRAHRPLDQDRRHAQARRRPPDSSREASAIAGSRPSRTDRPCIFQLPATSFFNAIRCPLHRQRPSGRRLDARKARP